MSRSVEGCRAVLGRRLHALKGAIERQNLEDTEFVYDQVLSAFRKLEEALGAREGTGEVVRDPIGDELRDMAADTDTLSFEITNMRPEKELTLSAEALEATGDRVKAWVAARIMHHWKRTGLAPKFAKIDVKVGVE